MAFAVAVSALALTSSPAQAITFLAEGDSFIVPFNGVVEGSVAPGLTGEVTYTLADIIGNTWYFNFAVENTSSAPITASRISTFGFNTDPNFTSAAITGGTVFDGVSSGNVPQHMAVEFCATAGPNCAGGSGEGVTIGDTALGQFALTFGLAPTSVSFDDLYVRYQSIVGAAGGDSGTGFPGNVPEPATWGMMILGIGMAGAVMRRRQRQSVRYNFA
jgi:hypothetical protein